MGEKRIGVAVADSQIRIAIAFDTILVDGTEIAQISRLIERQCADVLVVGYPRNQSGEATKQTSFVEHFVELLDTKGAKVVFQDESLTSVKAEELLNRQRKPYRKEDVDALAASLILQDYLEAHHG
ncbi:MAG: Holliday junction resolvase RuvX [Candidatus Saccharimonas sp.]